MNPIQYPDFFSPINFKNLTQFIKTQFQQVPCIQATLKIQLDEGAIFIDGQGEQNQVSNQNRPAHCTIHGNMADFVEILRQRIDPVTAFSNGNLQVEGDMEFAMQLSRLFRN